MSKYTTLLRWIIEQELDNKGLCHEEKNWKEIYDKIGLADYPIFNENYREELNNKIIRHYYFREIGLETAGLFRWYMRREMFEIMPYYNQLYESEILAKQMEPLLSFHEWLYKNRVLDHTSNDVYDEDTTARNVFDGEVNNTHEDEANYVLDNTHEDETNTHHENVFSDTPMNMLHDDDEPNPIASAKWATTVSYDNTNEITDGTYQNTENTVTDGTYKTETDNISTGTGTLDSTRDITANDNEVIDAENKGFRESQAKLLKEYRETFLNIDLDIVNSLRDLFFGLW